VFPNATKDTKGIWQIPEADINNFIQSLRNRNRRIKVSALSASAIGAALLFIFALISATNDSFSLFSSLAGFFEKPSSPEIVAEISCNYI